MLSKPLVPSVVVALAFGTAFSASSAIAGCSSSSHGGEGATARDAAVALDAADAGKAPRDASVNDGTVDDAPSFATDATWACSGSACDGGVCIPATGQCCAEANVCGDACCGSGMVCLFNACVAPGNACHQASDCSQGQYCEPALGSGADAGAPSVVEAGPGGAVCTEPLPIGGRCLPLPPVCPDAGAPDASGCIESCQYHPPAAATLDAVVKWSWGTAPLSYPTKTDVWSTPVVGRMHDTNCDGVIDSLDSPVIAFVAGDVENGNCDDVADSGVSSGCHSGVLRMLDGTTGQEIWSLASVGNGSLGFTGMSLAIGDVDGDGKIDIATVTAEGLIALIDGNGKVERIATQPIAGSASTSFGWGGALAIADMDLDGHPEIAYGAAVYDTTNGAITQRFVGTRGSGGGVIDSISTFVDLDGDPNGHLELLAGDTAYKDDGTVLWDDSKAPLKLPNGFTAVGDLDGNGTPEVVLVGGGQVWVLDGASGAIVLGPAYLPPDMLGVDGGTTEGGTGGAPTLADFDGDGTPEIGVAMRSRYSVMKPNFSTQMIDVLWQTPNHDYSSSVTGSTVFDFEGDGHPSVVYGDECYLWVFDGATGNVRYSTTHTSFTGTEASILADVDGDGHAEMVMVSNAASPKSWQCLVKDGDGGYVGTVVNDVTWAPGPAANQGYSGITVLGSASNSWVGTRTLWSEHTYHVTNICDDSDNACPPPNTYGSIPAGETKSWTLPWVNSFRQNVQGEGIFNAPDAVVALTVDCTSPVMAHVFVRNIGSAALPAGVAVAVYGQGGTQVGQATTGYQLFPGQTDAIDVTLAASAAQGGTYYAAVQGGTDGGVTFHECRTDNDTSASAMATCAQ